MQGNTRNSGKGRAAGAAAGLLAVAPLAVLGAADEAAAKTFKVTNKAKEGKGSFSRAVKKANGEKGKDNIVFASKLSGAISVRGDVDFTDVVALQSKSKNLRIKGKGRSTTLGFHAFGPRKDPKFNSMRGLDLENAGLYAEADLKVGDAVIDGAGPRKGTGASVYDYALLDIKNSTITGWTRGVDSYLGADVEIEDSIIAGNEIGTDVGKGGIEVRRSTITGNEIGLKAGYYGFTSLENSTVSANDLALYGNFNLESTTVTDNGTVIDSYYENTEITNSVIVDNGDPECLRPDVTSHGGNVFDAGSACFGGIAKPSDLLSGNARLGPLADNGGPTPTHALEEGSPAIGHAIKVKEPLPKDQRGVKRGKDPDSGAYEREG